MQRFHLQKKEREIKDPNEIFSIIKNGKYTTIAMCRNNEPYIVTLSYGYDEVKNALYFHSRLKGLKYEIIKENHPVCATIIEDKGYIVNDCAHAFRSVIIWGKMYFVETLEEKKHGMDILLKHLEENPDKIKQESLANDKIYKNLGIFRLDIMEIHGKWGR